MRVLPPYIYRQTLHIYPVKVRGNIKTEAHIHACILSYATHKHTPTQVYLIPQNTKAGDSEMELQQKYSIMATFKLYSHTCLPDITTIHRQRLFRAVGPNSSMLSCSGSWCCANLSLGFLTSQVSFFCLFVSLPHFILQTCQAYSKIGIAQ